MTGLLLSKYEKTLRDVAVKVRFLDAEKEYIVGFLDNERMTAVNGEVIHEQMMQDACRNFKKDIAQIDKLYELIMKETSNRATEKAYKDLYNNDYLEKIEQKEKNFEKEITNVNIRVGAVINSNYWRIEGLRNIYTAFREEISEKFNKSFSKYEDVPVDKGYPIQPISEERVVNEIKPREEEEFDEEELGKYEREENGYNDEFEKVKEEEQLSFDDDDLIKYEEDDDLVKTEDDDLIESEDYEDYEDEDYEDEKIEDEDDFDEDDFLISSDYEYKRKMQEIEMKKKMERDGISEPQNKRIIEETNPSINTTKTNNNDTENKNSNMRKIKIKNIKPHSSTEAQATTKNDIKINRPKINNFDNNRNTNINNISNDKKALKIRKPNLTSANKDAKIQNTIDEFMKNNNKEEARKANANFLNKIFKNNKDKNKVLKSS